MQYTALSIPKGNDFTIKMQILDRDTGDPLANAETFTYLLRVTTDVHKPSIAEFDGSVVSAPEALIQFVLSSAFMDSLDIRAYPIDVWVIESSTVRWQAFKGRLGVTASTKAVPSV